MGRKSCWYAAALACAVLPSARVEAQAAGVPGYRIETMAGSSSLGDGGTATAAQFGGLDFVNDIQVHPLLCEDKKRNEQKENYRESGFP